jgi:transcriptional regulator with XRE-family HTH domain
MAGQALSPETRARGSALAQRIKLEREKSGLSQQKLAIRARVGVDTLRAIERGRTCAPSVFTVFDLARALHKTVDELLSDGTPTANCG